MNGLKCNDYYGWTEFVFTGTKYTVKGVLIRESRIITYADVYGGIYHRYCDARQTAFADLTRFVFKLLEGLNEGVSSFDEIAERLIHE